MVRRLTPEQRLQKIQRDGVASSELPMFHDGPVAHTHSKCGKCLAMRRSHQFKLLRCAGCNFATYCSKECQKSDWPTHKTLCKRLKQEREEISTLSGIPNALEDLWAWVDFYDAPLKNCAIASSFLKENPHEEQRTTLFIILRHYGQSDLPVQHKFHVDSICRFPFNQLPPGRIISDQARETAERMGRVELGKSFYGIQTFVVAAHFNGEQYFWPKSFAIDKETARANVLQRDWEDLFCDYVEGGVKVKFCCGKLGGSSSNACCCGGWTHDKNKLKAFVEARDLMNQ